jgi:hypothetical protein
MVINIYEQKLLLYSFADNICSILNPIKIIISINHSEFCRINVIISIMYIYINVKIFNAKIVKEMKLERK